MIKEIHPVRAALAIITIGVTAFLLIVGSEVPDAWWTFLGCVGAFYFTDNQK